MKALQEFPDHPPLVERAVTIAVLLDHQNKEKLMMAAMRQFPDSKLLKDFLPQIGYGQ
jgi:hypothetical protein